MVTTEQAEQLITAAKEAASRSYSPYSNFSVGSAILTDDDRIFSGCNVENASYGLTNCAERTAMFSAASTGVRGIKAVVVYTPTEKVTPPCGSCRQVLNEFGPQCDVICVCDSDHRIETTLDQLLPGAFGPKNLADAAKL